MSTKFANNYYVMENFVNGLALVVRLMNLPDCTVARCLDCIILENCHSLRR